jgi:hypothetical protein
MNLVNQIAGRHYYLKFTSGLYSVYVQTSTSTLMYKLFERYNDCPYPDVLFDHPG